MKDCLDSKCDKRKVIKMSAMKNAIEKYCRVTNSKFIGYDNGFYCFYNEFDGKRVYLQHDLLREVSNFE